MQIEEQRRRDERDEPERSKSPRNFEPFYSPKFGSYIEIPSRIPRSRRLLPPRRHPAVDLQAVLCQLVEDEADRIAQRDFDDVEADAAHEDLRALLLDELRTHNTHTEM